MSLPSLQAGLVERWLGLPCHVSLAVWAEPAVSPKPQELAVSLAVWAELAAAPGPAQPQAQPQSQSQTQQP